MELGRETLRVTLAPAPGMSELPKPGEGRMLLRLEGIEAARPPGVYYEIYLGLPKGARPDPDGPHYVGNLSFFGRAGPGTSQVYDVTAVARALDQRGQWKGHTPSVTFVPRGLESARTGKALPAETAVKVHVGQVALVRG